MTATSTPGPWVYSEPKDEEKEWPVWAMQAPPGAKMPALCFGPDAAANAKLIAAAPALADALERLLRHGDDCDRQLCTERCPHGQGIAALRAAGRLP